ncbi:MAG: CPBP family intramembrane metalloprotease [Candidatus Thorarchaeota archaeon]|nr:CPBP family intramembrane metalloprotease [Candidatus Thorarchaeota archaeon]
MVMDDPDLEGMNEDTTIDVFTPGRLLESSIDGKQMTSVLVATGIALGLMLTFTFLLTLVAVLTGLIYVDFLTFEVHFEPAALQMITLSELGFIVPPLYYVKRRGLAVKSLGLRWRRPTHEVVIGLGVGTVMLASNLAISWLTSLFGVTPEAGIDPFSLRNVADVVLWTIIMFVIVGFSEELLFRGFLQRRMEMYLKTRSKSRPGVAALLITSFIFSLSHMDLTGFLARFILGMFLGYLAQRKRYSILGPTVAHGLNNSAIIWLLWLGF